jgi:hypothetical protein
MTATAQQLSLLGLAQAVQRHPTEMARCVAIARRLALRGPITIDDVRREAGLLEGRGRSLSYLGAVMRCAGLVPTGQYVRSELPVTHGNLRQVWRLP